MTGKTISTTLSHAVTISTSFPSPLTITSTGAIEPGADSGTALIVPEEAALVTIVNHGIIAAAAGAAGTYLGDAGYNAVGLYSGTTLNNTGTIRAGTGGASNTLAGAGGVGIDVQAAAIVVNSGLVSGGQGGFGNTATGVAGGGGIGVLLATAATLTNSGSIAGGGAGSDYQLGAGAGGGAGVSAGSEAYIHNTGAILGGGGGDTNKESNDATGGGYGVILGQGGSLVNSGNIVGGAGGGNQYTYRGGTGGTGISLQQATVQNTGAIAGGGGGYGTDDGGGSGGNGALLSDCSSFNNGGTLSGGNGYRGIETGGNGGDGILVEDGSTLANTGHITGGGGGLASYSYGNGGGGGIGVSIDSGSLINHGTINGGGAGSSYGVTAEENPFGTFGNVGGFGVDASNNAEPGIGLNIVNYGLIRGGSGDYISGYAGTATQGGAGVAVFTGTLVNHATIIGGTGGSANHRAGSSAYANTGGTGLIVYAQATNSGTIIGGAGGTDNFDGGAGGLGVLIEGGTFVDSGVVKGGAGGSDGNPGASGYAVYLSGNMAGTLVLDPGASFVGDVVAATTAANVLELAGSSIGTLSGIGTEFLGFSQISFASGSTRAVEGSIQSLGTIDGFAAHDTIILDDYTANLALIGLGGQSISLTNGTTADDIKLNAATAKDYIFSDGNGKTTIAAAGTLAHTIGTGSAQFVLLGGTSDNSKLTGTGMETVDNGGTASQSTIAGGTLVLDIGAHIANGVSFGTPTGGELIIDSTHMPTATISSFAVGDTIKLAGVVYNSNDMVTVATAGTVTIETPGVNYNLDIAGATVGETDFHFGTGSVLTRSAMPKMTFLAPDAAGAAAQEMWRSGTADTGLFVSPTSPEAVHFGLGGGGVLIATLEPTLIHGIGDRAFRLSNEVKLDALLAHHGVAPF